MPTDNLALVSEQEKNKGVRQLGRLEQSLPILGESMKDIVLAEVMDFKRFKRDSYLSIPPQRRGRSALFFLIGHLFLCELVEVSNHRNSVVVNTLLHSFSIVPFLRKHI